MTLRSAAARAFAGLALAALIAANAPLRITGQLLDYERGYVFFTTGDGFRVAPNVEIDDFATGKPSPREPRARSWARATFDDAGTVVKLELSRTRLPAEGDYAAVRHFAVALSTPVPNPELAPPPSSFLGGKHYSGKRVTVVFTVEVPPNTPSTAVVYLTTDANAWDPQAIRMDRLDALHFRVVRVMLSGTHLQYLYTRGSLQSVERAENGLDRAPHVLDLTDADSRTVTDVVYRWADDVVGGTRQIAPGTIPTPFNPNPFPNLPTGPSPFPRPTGL